jgi:hypothetical protein
MREFMVDMAQDLLLMVATAAGIFGFVAAFALIFLIAIGNI